jgi:endoglucanase
MRNLLTFSALVGAARAQGGPWAQCGGQGWTGPTTCVAGYTCTFSNQWYSQCLPGSSPNPPTTLTTSTRPTTTSTVPNPGTTGSWKWFGTNEAGGEFGEGTLPGQWGTHFIFPDLSAINVSTAILLFCNSYSYSYFYFYFYFTPLSSLVY